MDILRDNRSEALATLTLTEQEGGHRGPYNPHCWAASISVPETAKFRAGIVIYGHVPDARTQRPGSKKGVLENTQAARGSHLREHKNRKGQGNRTPANGGVCNRSSRSRSSPRRKLAASPAPGNSDVALSSSTTGYR